MIDRADIRRPDEHPSPQELAVVVLDGDAMARAALTVRLRAHGLATAEAESADAARALCVEHPTTGAVIADLGGTRALRNFIDSLRAAGSHAAVLACGADIGAREAIEWIRAGAADVLFKPFDAAEAVASIERCVQRTQLSRRGPSAIGNRPRLRGLDALVGADPRLAAALDLARAASRVRSTVLIEGESGTGKSMLARAIHEASSRADGPFVDLACGSVPETLLESELFGHVKGAFTGALSDKKGRFLAANGGTLFLDEINSASAAMQLKLLRVLQERRFEPVGSDEPIEVDVRVIVATNQPLAPMVADGRFRQDLFYRVHVLPIALPPLRERPGDARALAHHFLAKKSAELERTILGFTDGALEAIARHAWPGNVRELENAIERATILCEGATIGVEHLPGSVRGEHAPTPRSESVVPFPRPTAALRAPGTEPTAPTPGDASQTLAESLRDPVRAALVAALDAHGWCRTATARALGINRATLYRKMRDLGLVEMRRSA